MKKLRIRVAPWLPWIGPPQDGETKIHGVAYDVYDAWQKLNDLEYEIQVGETFGTLGPNNTWTGMIGNLVKNETDIAGPFFINKERAEVVDFTMPLGFSQLCIVSGLVSKNSNPFLMFEIFSFKVILALWLTALFCSGATCLIYYLVSNPYSTPKKVVSEIFLKYLWAFHISLIGKEFGSNSRWFTRHIWHTFSFRVLQSLWFMLCVIFIYTYQGAIISAFAADKLTPRVSTMREMLDDNNIQIGTFKNSYPYSCLKSLERTLYKPIFTRAQKNLFLPTKTGVMPNWFDQVEEGNLVFVGEMMLAKTKLSERFAKTRKCGIRVTALDFCSNYLAIAFRKPFNKNFTDLFNSLLLRFNEGLLLHPKLMSATLQYDICSEDDANTPKALAFSNLLAAFIFLVVGLALSFAVFFLEACIYKNNCGRSSVLGC